MKNSLSTTVFATIAVLAALIGSGIVLVGRFRVESRNKAVGLCVEMSVIHDTAASTGKSASEVLTNAKDHGLTGVVMLEATIGDKIRQGQAFLLRGVLSMAPEDRETYWQSILRRFPERPGMGLIPDGGIAIGDLDADAIQNVALGIEPEDAAMAAGAGLIIVARHENKPGATPAYVKSVLASSRALGAEYFLPSGDQALGQRTALEATAEALEDTGLLYAAPEFAKITGDAFLAKKRVDNMVRLHSIQAAEADRSSPAEIVERFVKAARERNIRLLLLRPNSMASEDAMTALNESLAAIRSGLAASGMNLGKPHTFDQPPKAIIGRVLVGLAVLLAALWCVASLRGGSLALAIAGGIGALALAGTIVDALTPLSALICAVVFPVVGYLLILRATALAPLLKYALCSGVCVVGGLGVASLISTRSYMMHVDQFAGVKLAHFGPILIVAGILLWSSGKVKDVLNSPVRWGMAIVSFLLLGALGFMLLRTGNDNPAAVSGLEMRMRSILDAILFVRPRTKEFLLGHPAFVVGLFMFAASKIKPSLLGWALFLMAVGAIGQTSIVNTLCHAHTPLDLSLARIVTGWVSGGLIGLAIWFLIKPSMMKTSGDPR